MEDYGAVASLVASGVVFWSTAFLLVRALLPNRSFDFCNRAVSTMHAIAGVALGCLSRAGLGLPRLPGRLPFLAAPDEGAGSDAVVHDLRRGVLPPERRRATGQRPAPPHQHRRPRRQPSLPYQKCGTEQVACLLVTEISSPLLHLREMLKELGVKDTDLNLIVDILFAVTFSVARMVFGTYVTYRTVTADNPIFIKVMATSLLLVSAYWFLRIFRMVRHKIGKKRLASKAACK